MGVGSFGDDGELFFELQLIPANGEAFSGLTQRIGCNAGQNYL
jgi:hypothetical protein